MLFSAPKRPRRDPPSNEQGALDAESARALTAAALNPSLEAIVKEIDERIKWSAKRGWHTYNADTDGLIPIGTANTRHELQEVYEARGFDVRCDSLNFVISWPIPEEGAGS